MRRDYIEVYINENPGVGPDQMFSGLNLNQRNEFIFEKQFQSQFFIMKSLSYLALQKSTVFDK